MDAGEAIGRRIAHVRKLRGLTQIGLARRAHVSKSLISQVESGHKPATPSLVAAVSTALDVDATDLTGRPYRGTDARSDRVHAAIPQIRQALVYWDIPPILDVPPRPLSDLAAEMEQVRRLRSQASYVEPGALLPALLKELTVHATRRGIPIALGPSGSWRTPIRRWTRWPTSSGTWTCSPSPSNGCPGPHARLMTRCLSRSRLSAGHRRSWPPERGTGACAFSTAPGVR